MSAPSARATAEPRAETDEEGRACPRLEIEYRRLRRPAYRIRHAEFCLVEEHVHVEALALREDQSASAIARGLRFVIRSEAVKEPPSNPYTRRFESPPPELPNSWLDPVREGPGYQSSTEVFVDLAQIEALNAGVASLLETGARWRREALWSEYEMTFAWTDCIVLGVIQRQQIPAAYFQSRAYPPMYVTISPSRLFSFRDWLTRVNAELPSQ